MSVAPPLLSGRFGSGPLPRNTGSGKPFTPTVGVGVGPGGFGGPAAAGATAIVVTLIATVAMLSGADAQRVLLTASLSMTLFALINFAPPVGAIASLIYLMCVGGLKRALIPVLGYVALDPLLMAVPLVVGLMTLNRIIQRQVPRDTHLDKIILAFLFLMALEVFNPLQGGLAIGFSGAFFYIVPVLWFYIGRRAATDKTIKGMFIAFVIVACIGAIYGLYQTWFGFSDVEKQWLAITKNDSGLHLGKATRVFSVFSSFAEYCHILIIACVFCFAGVLKKNRLLIPLVVFLFVCIVLSSSRGAVLSVLFGCLVLWAVQGKKIKSWIPRLILSGIVGAATLVVGIGQVSNNTKQLDAVTSNLVDHQVKGLTDPFNASKGSTGGAHLSLIWGGITAGFRNPLGTGLGATTLATGKFDTGGANIAGTESDYGDMFASLGFVGGFLYLYIIYHTLRTIFSIWRKTRSFASLCVMGMLIAESGLWMHSGHYATTMIIWFSIGWIGRYELQEKLKSSQTQKARFRPQARRLTEPQTVPQSISPIPVPSSVFVPAGGGKMADLTAQES